MSITVLKLTISNLDDAEIYGKGIEREQDENSNWVKSKGATNYKNASMHIYLFSCFLWAWYDNQAGKYDAIDIVTVSFKFLNDIINMEKNIT